MTVDKENEDPMPSHLEKMRNPSKSILKDNTVPIPSNKRRVSFAPEVTLHKFDFVPYDSMNDSKRRRTIGNFTGDAIRFAGEEELREDEAVVADGGLEMLSDSSDSDDDISFSKIEIHTDFIVEGLEVLNRVGDQSDLLNTVNNQENGDFEGSKEEVATTENIQENGQKIQEVKENELLQQVDSFPVDEDNEEQTMELTGQLPVADGNKINEPGISHSDTLIEPLSSSGEDSDGEADMELTGTQRVRLDHVESNAALESHIALNNENSHEIIDDGSKLETLEDDANTGTEPAEAKDSHKPIETTENLQNGIPEYPEPFGDHDDVSMDITKIWSVTKSNASHIEHPHNEHSRLTKPSDESVVQNSSNSDINDKLELLTIYNDTSPIKLQFPKDVHDEEQTMDITLAASHSTRPVVEEEDSTETMELTQVSSVVIPPKSNNPTMQQLESVPEAEESNTGSKVAVQPPFAKFSKTETETETESQELGSQPMQLTQENQVLIRKSPLPVDLADPDVSTDTVRQEVVTTIKVPLINTDQDNDHLPEQEDEDEEYTPVKLNEFMSDIGVKFYDDLDIDIYLTKRLSITTSSIDEEQSFGLKDYIKAFSKLELLALYQFSCEELNKNIQEGKKVFAEYNETIESNNPELFKEYYSSDYQEKLNLNVKLQLIRDFTRHQSKITWYDWRTQLTSNLIQELEIKHQSLLDDKLGFINEIQQIDKILNETKQTFQGLKIKLRNLMRFKEQLNGLDFDKLEGMKIELHDVTKNLETYKENIESKRKELVELDQTLKKIEEMKVGLVDEISEKETTLNNTRKYELDEVKVLNLKFKILETLGNLKFQKTGKGLRFIFDEVVDVRMNFENNLETQVSIVNDEGKFFNPWLLENFGPKVAGIIKNYSKSTLESFKKFKKVWNLLKNLDKDIHLISLKYPLSVIGSTDSSIEFETRYFNFERDYKMALTFKIAVDDIEKYTTQVEIEGRMLRHEGQINLDLLKQEVKNDLSFVKLIDQISGVVIREK